MWKRILPLLLTLTVWIPQARSGVITYEQDATPVLLGSIVGDGTLTYSISPLQFPQFDPSLGVLNTVSLEMNYLYSFNVTSGTQGVVAYSGSGGNLYLAGYLYNSTGGGGFFASPDGTTDGAYQVSLYDSSQLDSVNNQDALDLLTGTDSIEWFFDASFDFNLVSNFHPNPGAEEDGYLTSGSVILTYQYDDAAPAVSEAPEPSTGALLLTGGVVSFLRACLKMRRQRTTQLSLS